MELLPRQSIIKLAKNPSGHYFNSISFLDKVYLVPTVSVGTQVSVTPISVQPPRTVPSSWAMRPPLSGGQNSLTGFIDPVVTDVLTDTGVLNPDVFTAASVAVAVMLLNGVSATSFLNRPWAGRKGTTDLKSCPE